MAIPLKIPLFIVTVFFLTQFLELGNLKPTQIHRPTKAMYPARSSFIAL
jgi:hypothetical protein